MLIVNPDGANCEPVKWHSRQKHAFLEEYLNIWTNQVGLKKGSKPTLDIFDLHASCGLCYCKDQKETWNGSALIAAKCLKNYSQGRLLFLNTYHPSENELQSQIPALKENLNYAELPSRVKVEIQTLPLDKAIEKAILLLNPDYPSFWILDPYKPEELPWNIVEKVCRLEGHYKTGKERRPELFINLMTGTLQRYTGLSNLKDDPVGITLGMAKNEWETELLRLREQGCNTREALIRIYAEKLMRFYNKLPIILDVPSVQGNIVYTVFLCTDSDAGHYVMKLHKLPEYQKWQEFEWGNVAEQISRKNQETRKAAKSGRKQLFFDDFEDTST
jgi:three-Cys-motif partner protein